MKNHKPVVKLVNISKSFPGVQALDRVSFEIYPGEIVAVVGENGAGKTTLMNILAGVHQPDEGCIEFMGEKTVIENPNFSQKLGINVVYQEMSTCPNLSIAENILLNELGNKPNLSPVNTKENNKKAGNILSQFGLTIGDLNTPVGNLSIAHQQLVEIAKAVSTNAKIIIFDEPTSALTEEDNKRLYKIIKDLKVKGVSILYVSHRFGEVIALADKIVVLRDGKYVDTLDPKKASIDQLIEKVAGRAIDDLYKNKAEKSASRNIRLEVNGLSLNSKMQNLSFHVYNGELLGIAGLPDSGKDELAECLYGLRRYEGEISIDGKPVALKTPTDAICNGISYIPANRREAGAILSMNARDNIAAASLSSLSTAGFIQKHQTQEVAKTFIDQFRIKVSSLLQIMSTISGGNQQKIILSRCLATKPKILVLHEPTRGIDVGAKAEIYNILGELAKDGVSIVIISSELAELMSQCNRILVLYNGKMQGQFEQEKFEEKRIASCLMGESVCL